MHVTRETGDICPICQNELHGRNFWVPYHIRYGTNPICILACRYCNYTEWALRNQKIDRLRCATPNRVNQILILHKKFGCEILNTSEKIF